MKNLLFIACIAPLMFVVACSSMKVDDSDSTEENYPADFSVAVYSEMYPGIAMLQVRDSIAAYNKTLAANDTVVIDTADAVTFLADTAVGHIIFTEFVGYADSLWTGNPNTEQTKMMEYFNTSNMTPAQDLQHCRNIRDNALDSSLIALQFYMYGQAEGRPYRYCTDSDSKSVEQDTTQAVMVTTEVNSKDVTLADYGSNLYCEDETSGTIYLIED